jgi:RNA polymerase sigma factor (sigma-70 family)
VAVGGERTDAELVAAACAGDKEAFALLADRHQGMVLALARRMLEREDLAADAVSEATVAALVGLGRLRSAERFGAWYAGIALNVARRWLRERAAFAPLPGEWADGRPGPEERAEAADLAARVRRAVAGLAPGQREAVLAFYWQGMTHAEAAAELGISPGAVKARLHQARAVLAGQLGADDGLAQRRKPTKPTKETRTMAGTAGTAGTTESGWVEVSVAEVRRGTGEDPTSRPHAVILTERGGSRRLPIWTASIEATALACTLEAVETPRPMTYQLAVNLVQAAQAPIAEVRITRLTESVFYAVVVLDRPTGRVEVDARPSDALNLALVAGCPILVDAALLDDPRAAGRTGWQPYPTGTAELAAEVRQRNAEALAAILAEREQPER